MAPGPLFRPGGAVHAGRLLSDGRRAPGQRLHRDRNGDPGAVHHQLRLDLHVVLDRHHRLSGKAGGTRSRRARSEQARCSQYPDGDHHAGLQRGPGAGLRRAGGDVALPSKDGGGERAVFRPLHPQRYPQAGNRRGRGIGLGGAVPSPECGRPDLLPATGEQYRPQGRQYRRFPASVGPCLRSHAGAGRRQHHVGRYHGGTRQTDAGQPWYRHHPDLAGAGEPGNPVRPHPPVRQPGLWSGAGERAVVVAVGRGELLGPQRYHPDQRLHRELRAADPVGAGAAGRRDPQPRLRRGRPDAQGRLAGLDRAGVGRQL